MTVFVTGITGFIGSHVATAAADAGYDVVGLHRPRPTHTETLHELRSHDNIQLRTGDLHDGSTIRAHIRDVSPTTILHFGALTSVAYSFDHPQEVHAVNATGTLALAEAARKDAPELELFAFASSMELYGNQVSEPLGPDADPPVYAENDIPRPAAPYAAAKLGAEAHLEVLHRAFGFPSVSIRQTNAYGRRYNDYFVVEAFATAMLDADEGDAVNFGDPRPYRNFIHIDDLVELYLTLLDSDTSDMHGEVFNTGPPNAIEIRELADRLRDLTGFDGDINWHTREHRPGEVWSLNSDSAKLEGALGWTPTVGLDEGLRRVVEHWLARPK